MTMGRQYNMPVSTGEYGDQSSMFSSPKLYRPLPEKGDIRAALDKGNKEGLKVVNEIVVPLGMPSKWKIFNPDPATAQNLGYVNAPNPIALPAELNTYYFKFPVHEAANFTRPDGTVGFSWLICPDALNTYLKSLSFGSLFEQPRCAYCEQKDVWWGEYFARREVLGHSRESWQAMTADLRRSISDSDPILKRCKDLGKKYSPNDRYVVNVFDHDKFTGKRPLDENQQYVAHQVWLAPKTIFGKLENIFAMSKDQVAAGLDVPFFDTSSPMGCHVMSVIKDCTKCTKTSMRDTDYDVLAGKRYKYPDQWLAYLDNVDAMVDPSEFLFLPSYADVSAYLAVEDSKGQRAAVAKQVPAGYGQPPAFNTQPAFNPSVPMPQGFAQPQPQPASFQQAPQVTPYVPPAPHFSNSGYASVPTPQPYTQQMPQAQPQVSQTQFVPPPTPQEPPPQMQPPMPAPQAVPTTPQPPVPMQAPVPQRMPTVPLVPAVQNGTQMPPSFSVPAQPQTQPQVPPQMTPPVMAQPAQQLPDRNPPPGNPAPGARHKW